MQSLSAAYLGSARTGLLWSPGPSQTGLKPRRSSSPKEDASESDFPEHGSDDSSSPTEMIPAEQTPSLPFWRGRFFSEVGTPLSGIQVIACNADSCVKGAPPMTTAPTCSPICSMVPGKWKPSTTPAFMDLVFHQTAEEPAVTIQLPYADQQNLNWSAQEGGTLNMFNGGLQLIADPGSLSFPEEETELQIAVLQPGKFPPYGSAPWEEKRDKVWVLFLIPPPWFL